MTYYKKVSDNRFKLYVKAIPNAKREAIVSKIDKNNQQYLKVSITVVAENNKANSAIIQFLSKKLKLAKSNFSLEKGNTDSYKIFVIENVVEDNLLSLLEVL